MLKYIFPTALLLSSLTAPLSAYEIEVGGESLYVPNTLYQLAQVAVFRRSGKEMEALVRVSETDREAIPSLTNTFLSEHRDEENEGWLFSQDICLELAEQILNNLRTAQEFDPHLPFYEPIHTNENIFLNAIRVEMEFQQSGLTPLWRFSLAPDIDFVHEDRGKNKNSHKLSFSEGLLSCYFSDGYQNTNIMWGIANQSACTFCYHITQQKVLTHRDEIEA